MANNGSSGGGGIGFVGLLTIVFIVLKLTHVIEWSWVWVLAPLWISASITAVILLVVGIIFLVLYISDKKSFKKRSHSGRARFGKEEEK